MNILTKKKCSICGIEKLCEKFCLDKRMSNGLRSECKSCTADYNREYRKRPGVKKAQSIYLRQWKEGNAEKARKGFRDGHRRYRNTLKGNLNNRISRAISKVLVNGKRGRHWESLVGYTVVQLKKHIEKKFLPGMTWENRNLWQIDHKIPIAVFNFQTEKDIDFKKCWTLSNLQPLWSKENIKKFTKLNKPFQPSLKLGG